MIAPLGSKLPAASGGARQREREGLAVEPAPFGYDVSHQATVMGPAEDHGRSRGATDVEPVHPGVAGEDRVDQVAELPSLGIERRILLHADSVPNQSRRPPTGRDSFRGDGHQAADD